MWILIKSFNIFVDLIEVLIIVRMFLSFIIRDMNNPLSRLIYQITEPIISPFRELIYRLGINTGMIDFSPLLAILFLNFLVYLLNLVIIL